MSVTALQQKQNYYAKRQLGSHLTFSVTTNQLVTDQRENHVSPSLL